MIYVENSQNIGGIDRLLIGNVFYGWKKSGDEKREIRKKL